MPSRTGPGAGDQSELQDTSRAGAASPGEERTREVELPHTVRSRCELEQRLFVQCSEERFKVVRVTRVEEPPCFGHQLRALVNTGEPGERLHDEVPTRARLRAALCLGHQLTKRRARSGNVALVQRRPSEDDERMASEEIPVRVVRAFGCFEALECTSPRAVELPLHPKDFSNVRGRSGGWKSYRSAFQLSRAREAVMGFEELPQRNVGSSEPQPGHADLVIEIQ